jgi:hypothetical protein
MTVSISSPPCSDVRAGSIVLPAQRQYTIREGSNTICEDARPPCLALRKKGAKRSSRPWGKVDLGVVEAAAGRLQ